MNAVKTVESLLNPKLNHKTIGIFARYDRNMNNWDLDQYNRAIYLISEPLLYEGATLAFINDWAKNPMMEAVCTASVKSKKMFYDETVIHYTKPEFVFDTDPKMKEYKILKTVVSNTPEKDIIEKIDAAIFLTGYQEQIKNVKKPVYVSQFFERYEYPQSLINKSGLSENEWKLLTNEFCSIEQFSALALRGLLKRNNEPETNPKQMVARPKTKKS